MNYEDIAEELLIISSEMSRLRISRNIDELSRGELFVLDFLEKNGQRVNSKAIVKELNVSSARVAALVNQLEKKEDVCRIPDSEDNRQTIVQLTEKGKDRLLAKRRQIKTSTIEMLEKLGLEDAAEYLRIQKKIIEQ